MAKWLAPALGAHALVTAASAGASVRAQKGDSGTCDSALLAAVLGVGVPRADQRGQAQFDTVCSARCSEEDLASVLPEVTRAGHMMPGGTMTREPSHTASTP